MDKSCGNCRYCGREYCNNWPESHQILINNIEVDCLGFASSYAHLESQLAAYQPHPFNPDDRGTWPPTEKYVVVYSLKRYVIAKIDNEGEWFDDSDSWLNPLIFKPKWWCKLPGGTNG